MVPPSTAAGRPWRSPASCGAVRARYRFELFVGCQRQHGSRFPARPAGEQAITHTSGIEPCLVLRADGLGPGGATAEVRADLGRSPEEVADDRIDVCKV